MQVEELYDLTSWVQSEISDKGIVKKYQQLHEVLQFNAQQNQQQKPFEEQKNALIQSLEMIPLVDLSIGQLDILSIIGIADNVGEEGVKKLEESLFRNVIDTATASSNVQASTQDIDSGIQWSQQTRDLLTKIINSEEVSEIGESVLLRVHFTGDAHLSNLTEFKDWGKIWWDIGRGIAMAHNEAPENIRVVGASKGSIIVSLLTVYGIAKTTSGIIMEALKVAEKVLDIKKKAQEVRALKLANELAEKSLGEAEDKLNEAAQSEKENGVEKIIETTIEKLGLNRNGEGDKVSALDSSIRKLVDFVEKGGEIDFVLPDEEEINEEDEEAADANIKEREDLRMMFKEIRQLEKKVHQLEYKKAP
jgi:hypothetical protein